MQTTGKTGLPVFNLKMILFRCKDVESLLNLIVMNKRTVQNLISSSITMPYNLVTDWYSLQ
ncbi:hypothetical protein CXP54_23385 [Escherichia albertii]|nr:hypothetical protein A5955_13140 [Escherichia coli]AUS68253.1 hypothetical protein CXP54_23385 [Escherichia albertii]EEW2719460.1 hypothetical protein [Escherichia coli]EFN9946719.1 hypothetical protein [Escherichia coli]EGD5183856.1 hypothetical protein [Escherichia coli]